MSTRPELRPVQRNELDALHQLIIEIEQAEAQPYLTAREEVDELFEDEINPAADNLRVLQDDGQMIGWGRVAYSASGKKLERAFLRGGVHPNHKRRGWGEQILAWQTARASERLTESPNELEAVILAERYEWQEDKHALFSAGGYEPARYFDELERSLTEPIPPTPTLAGIRIEPWVPEHTEAARLVYNVAFLDHWGTTPRSEAAWRSDVIECFGRRLDLSFVAHDGNEMVGYCLNAHYPEDENVTGRRDGWVDSICTLGSHRGRGIATSLLIHSLQAFARAGLDGSMLGVDSNNPTGAYGIYERLGYRPLHRQVVHLRSIRPATTTSQLS